MEVKFSYQDRKSLYVSLMEGTLWGWASRVSPCCITRSHGAHESSSSWSSLSTGATSSSPLHQNAVMDEQAEAPDIYALQCSSLS